MFARPVHVFQIFSILMLFLITSKSNPAVGLVNFEYSMLAIATFSTIGFLATLGAAARHKKLIIILALVSCLLISLNFLIFTPSMGLIAILLTGLVLSSVVKKAKKLGVGQFYIPKYQVTVAYLLYAIPFFVLAPHKVQAAGLLFFSLFLAGLSTLYVCLTFAEFRRNVEGSIAIIVLLIFGLFVAEQSFVLEIGGTILFLVVTGMVSYVLFNLESLRTIEASYGNIFAKPELVIVGYFALGAIVGSFLLQTPIAQANPLEMSHKFLDSLFTAMSAICVTGLIVLDTPVDFSFVGQATILSLIQLGGLGITSLSAWILLIVSSGRLNLAHEDTLHSMSGNLKKINVQSLVKRIFIYFLVFELAGALLLFPSFLVAGDRWYMALWRALFTSISAFCNAGFALQSDSLVSYQSQPLVIGVVSLLIIAGGFAPLLALDLPGKVKKMRLGLQDKIVLSSTLVLLSAGFLYFIAVEWDYSLNGLSFFDKLMNAWFQSVTTRTAGFNSIELADMRSVTQLFFMLLMFVGGNPGSAAGGVKTVTVAVLAIAALNALKERDEAAAFFKRIPHLTVFRSLLIVVLGLGIHFVSFFFLSVTQSIDPIDLLFETFSALGTVGLSLGATAQLDEIGKVIIIFCMLAGRVGPLTFIFLLLRRQKTRYWKVPQEDVSIT